MFAIYSKVKNQVSFKPVNLRTGKAVKQVKNATVYGAERLQYLQDTAKHLNSIRPLFKYEVRQVNLS